jgi:hypothetical protein
VSSCDHVDTLVSAPRGPFFGPLAHGFACGPHIPIHNADPWNTLVDPVGEYEDTRDALAESWGVTSTEEWREQVDYLLAGENVGPETDLLLQLRRQLIGQYGRYDLPMWRDSILRWCQGRGVDAEQAQEFTGNAGVITRYEARFRADGLLPPNGIVNSVLGYDFGRAVNMARWGFGARFCDYRTAESVILRASQLTRQYYVSWADFGAGYALGRVIRFDNEEYGHMYDSVLGPHLMLLNDPASPWRHIPF